MMLCSRCKKRQAVVFITKADNANNTEQEGLCMVCAKELNIKPISDLIEKMGISDEDMESLDQQMGEMFGEMGLMNPEELSDGEGSEASGDFSPGGAVNFPFLNNVFGNREKNNADTSADKKENKAQTKDKKPKRKYLDTYCHNLTLKAQNGELDRIIGRDNEIYRVVQILSRRTKNNPCLIGEPGVGKTAIAEGLALRIADGQVPLRLQSKQIHLLDLTALVAGTQFRGQFESRIKGLVDEVKADGNIILFIDEVHNLVGTGDAEGSMNAANILKPALSRGEIQVIGATTFKEYRKYIEKDSALERRFQPVTIIEPSVQETIAVLKGIKNYYEDYHRVTISDAVAARAAVLSERYISDRFLPDKAIDLMDEACAHAALRNVKMAQYDKLQQALIELRCQEEALNADVENIDYEGISKVRSEIIVKEQEASALEEDALGTQVTGDDLAQVIELWTSIPAAKIEQQEMGRLSSLPEKLRKKVIGQDEAVDLVSAAIRRSRVQISPRRRPASFIFVGPTGVGKTELVKVLAAELFDSPETLIRLDMSEYMEKHSVSRIVGSPPGYVGYDEAGQLTEKVRRKPYSVLLFDEIEKAHPDVLNILLQILDEGHITDSHGRTVNFENTVIVMTSNAGSNTKGGVAGFGRTENDQQKEKATKALSDFLRPEFLSRVDEIVLFNRLTLEDFQKIAVLMLEEYVPSLEEKGIAFLWDDAVTSLIARKTHGGKNAARDLRGFIRRQVEDAITSLLVDRCDTPPSHILLTEKNDDIILETK